MDSPPNSGKHHSVLTHSLWSESAYLRARSAVRHVVPDCVWIRLFPLCRFLDALQFALRSFSGHMRTLLSERFWYVILGHPLVFLRNGLVIRNNRTAARSYGIRQLTSQHPWASLDERRAFLDGFDLGEQFGSGNLSIPESEFVAIGASEFPSWQQVLDSNKLPATQVNIANIQS